MNPATLLRNAYIAVRLLADVNEAVFALATEVHAWSRRECIAMLDDIGRRMAIANGWTSVVLPYPGHGARLPFPIDPPFSDMRWRFTWSVYSKVSRTLHGVR